MQTPTIGRTLRSDALGNKKQNKTTKKSKTNGPSVGSSTGKWAPTFPKSSIWDLGWGAVPTTNRFLKKICAHLSVDAGTETQTELKLTLAHIACEANSRT